MTQGYFPKLVAEVLLDIFSVLRCKWQQFNNTCKAKSVIILKNAASHVIWSLYSLKHWNPLKCFAITSTLITEKTHWSDVHAQEHPSCFPSFCLIKIWITFQFPNPIILKEFTLLQTLLGETLYRRNLEPFHKVWEGKKILEAGFGFLPGSSEIGAPGDNLLLAKTLKIWSGRPASNLPREAHLKF